jgi:hypothetical protein
MKLDLIQFSLSPCIELSPDISATLRAFLMTQLKLEELLLPTLDNPGLSGPEMVLGLSPSLRRLRMPSIELFDLPKGLCRLQSLHIGSYRSLPIWENQGFPVTPPSLVTSAHINLRELKVDYFESGSNVGFPLQLAIKYPGLRSIKLDTTWCGANISDGFLQGIVSNFTTLKCLSLGDVSSVTRVGWTGIGADEIRGVRFGMPLCSLIGMELLKLIQSQFYILTLSFLDLEELELKVSGPFLFDSSSIRQGLKFIKLKSLTIKDLGGLDVS